MEKREDRKREGERERERERQRERESKPRQTHNIENKVVVRQVKHLDHCSVQQTGHL